MTPPATIVMPLLRQKDEWLDQAVRSAVTQTVPCEVIVVSSRETPPSNHEILKRVSDEYGNLRVLFRDMPRGFPQTLNFGMRAARAERIGILFSDDWLEPDCIAECLKHEQDIVSTSHRTYHADGVTPIPRAVRTLRLEAFEARPTLEAKASYLAHFFFFQKAALEQAGYADETIGDYPGIDDYHMIWTMLELGASVAVIEKHLLNVRDHGGERLTLADPVQAVRNLEKILHKHGVEEPEFSRLVGAHSRWYGKTLFDVIHEPPAEKA